MLTDPKTDRLYRATTQRARDAAEDDLEALDALLVKAHALAAEVEIVAPHLNTDRARERLAMFADTFADCLGDTIRAARQYAADALDDAGGAAPAEPGSIERERAA
jgi:hypothetical protein